MGLPLSVEHRHAFYRELLNTVMGLIIKRHTRSWVVSLSVEHRHGFIVKRRTPSWVLSLTIKHRHGFIVKRRAPSRVSTFFRK